MHAVHPHMARSWTVQAVCVKASPEASCAPRIVACVVERTRNRPIGNLMRLNPPSLLIFWIAFLLALVAIATKLGTVGVPRYVPHQEYWLAIVAYFTLMLGNIVRGL